MVETEKKMVEHSCSCCNKQPVKKGYWTQEEDEKLLKCISIYQGPGNWATFSERAGLQRCRRSCRLRWVYYLHPGVKHGDFTSDEVNRIVFLQNIHGNRWAEIAKCLPGRTGNKIKNFWNSKLKKHGDFTSADSFVPPADSVVPHADPKGKGKEVAIDHSDDFTNVAAQPLDDQMCFDVINDDDFPLLPSVPSMWFDDQMRFDDFKEDFCSSLPPLSSDPSIRFDDINPEWFG